MARRALGPASQQVVAAVSSSLSGPAMVACSGGPDSLALAAAAAIVAKRQGLLVTAAVVDHQLQPGSATQADSAKAQLEALGLSTQVLPVTVAGAGGLEAAARRARYAALSAAAAEADVLLGHTLDDQAETVLLGLGRGSGARSLAGMAPRRGRFVRPLLGLRAAVTAQACAEFGLTPWVDPHNSERRFARVRVRTAVLPVLEAELGPGVAEALARTAGLLREDADLLDELAAAELAGRDQGDSLDCGWLLGLPPALRGRIVRDWLRHGGTSDLSAGHVQQVLRLVTHWRGQQGVDLPGLRVWREQGQLRRESA